jgi:hypothetical protein
MAAGRKSFRAKIREGRGGGTFVEIPFDVKEAWGAGRVKVKATFDGEPYVGSVASMGGAHVLGVLKGIRAKLGKSVGDTVKVTVEPDTAPRTVAVPKDLAAALRRSVGAKRAFDALAYTYRKELVRALEGAKKPETRERRLAAAVKKLERGERP